MDHEKWMQRCLQLARLGEGFTAPNPLVGAVLVKDDRIIAEGWHRAFGGDHAEVDAIRQVDDKTLLSDATLYVNLEPCSHHGKTPPCSLKIIESGIQKVVVAAQDPNPLVAGKGLDMLKAKGIEVVSGILEEEAIELNRKFYTFHCEHRPYISLKWAETADGFIGKERYGLPTERLISGEASRYVTHQLRAAHQAILSGRKTIQTDDPQLTLRHWVGRNPLRIVLDPNHWIKSDFKLLTDGFHTLIFTQHHSDVVGAVEYEAIGAPFDLQKIISRLYARDIQSILVEGGSGTLQSFIDAGLWDEVWQIKSLHNNWGKGIPAPQIQAKLIESRILDDDLIFRYQPL